jgi:hypothetical protein
VPVLEERSDGRSGTKKGGRIRYGEGLQEKTRDRVGGAGARRVRRGDTAVAAQPGRS